MSEVYLKLICPNEEKMLEADTSLGRFAHFNDTSEPGQGDFEMLYHIHNVSVASVLGWLFAARVLKMISSFQIQENEDEHETQIIYLPPNDEVGLTHAYRMYLNEDTFAFLPDPKLPSSYWIAPHDVIEKQLSEQWEEVIFVSEEEAWQLVTLCKCGKPIENLLLPFCKECNAEIKEMEENNSGNGDQSEMFTDFVGSRMGQKPDLSYLICGMKEE
jgi:hypothetical protein